MCPFGARLTEDTKQRHISLEHGFSSEAVNIVRDQGGQSPFRGMRRLEAAAIR